jgi:uncharacterized glyoxalase superfamily protein PhnB
LKSFCAAHLGGSWGVIEQHRVALDQRSTLMGSNRPVIAQLNIVAKQFDETLRFYRLLGLDIPEPTGQPPGALHAVVRASSEITLEIDNEFLARIYHAGHRRSQNNAPVVIGLSLGSRPEVDETYSRLVAAGYAGRQPPFDAFWGARYAIVADPEGNDVGLMSPVDEAKKSWPPENAPEV